MRNNFVRYLYRPFDVRWLYWEPETKLLDEKRAEYFPNVFDGNVFLFTTGKIRKDLIEPPVFTRLLSDLNCMDSGARGFPLWIKPTPDEGMFRELASDKPLANLSDTAKDYLNALCLGSKPEELFYHTLAVLHASTYRMEHSGALRQDWPRVPLPRSREAMLASAELGKQVAALLDTESQVAGVTKNARVELKTVAVLCSPSNLSVTADWGRAQDGKAMPGNGKLVTKILDVGAGCKLPWFEFHDVYLNESACWKDIPAPVWDYTIGGYQVIKKWLSYREFELLGRPLTPDEAREVTHMARRIAALILLQPELDKNYAAVKSAPIEWNDFATSAK
jgi:predicted helicase